MLLRGIASLVCALGTAGCNTDFASRKTLFGAGAGAIPSGFVATLRAWDLDRNGIVTCTEWSGYAQNLFELLDSNHDGFLTDAEFQKLIESEPPFEHGTADYFDADGDRRVSRPEFLNRPNPVYAQFDANSDCKLTPVEQGTATP